MPILSIEIPWDPDITKIGGLLLTWHGLFTAIGIFAGVRLSLILAKVVDYDYDDAYTLALVGVPSGIVGARALFVIEHWSRFSGDPVAMIRLTEGGISIWGAILGGVGGALAFGLWKGYPIARGLDIASFGIILGQATGRLGDLVNGEHLANASDLPWAVFYTHLDSPAFVHSLAVGPHHPATTYELIGDLVILGALFVLMFGALWRRPGLTFFRLPDRLRGDALLPHLPARRLQRDVPARSARPAAGLAARGARLAARGLVLRDPRAIRGARAARAAAARRADVRRPAVTEAAPQVVLQVVLFSREGCSPCAHARDALRRLGREFAFELHERDVDVDAALAARYGDRVPVIAVDGREVSEGRIDAGAVRRALDGGVTRC